MNIMNHKVYPFLKARKTKSNAFDQYYQEPKILGIQGLIALMDHGKQWAAGLSDTLNKGGAALFPHTFLSQCGYQIAAVVNAVFDSGADQVLALGVLHPMTESMMQACSKELNEEDLSMEVTRGIFGPDSDPNGCIKHEFSLDLFKILFDFEVRRRGIKPPKLIERYPSLTQGHPEQLPGIKDLIQISKDSLIIATDDMCHHGIGYGVANEDAYPLDEIGYRFAQNTIEIGFSFLRNNQYKAYFDHWMNPLAIGDPTDTSIVTKYLLGDATPRILDLKLVDVSMLFEQDIAPSWVAATLVEFKRD